MKYLTILMLLFILFGNRFNANGQDEKFQALIMYNFTKLLDWPDKSGDFVISVIGNVELVKELKEYTADRKAGGVQDIIVKKVLISELGNCQMIYVGSSESSNLNKIIEIMGSNNTLLITEKNGLTDEGASISFVKINGAWKFQFNELNIKTQGLKVSSDFKELGIAK
ncbi:MAG: YfiR family protein [Bacteroidota bacterium]